MRGGGKSKVLTSGRLTGRLSVRPVRKRVSSNPAVAASASCLEPAYSLYSTDSEDQVLSLHNGLDRCAALLGGILQAEKEEASSCPTGGVKGGAAKPRPTASLGKKEKPPTLTGQRARSIQRGPRPTLQSSTLVKLHLPQKQPHIKISQRTTSSLPPPSVTLPSASPQLPQPDSPSSPKDADCGEEEDECVPVRDTNPHSTHSHTHICVAKMGKPQQEPGRVDRVSENTPNREDSGEETNTRMKTVQGLLCDLKALITGQGCAAEQLLSQLEQTMPCHPMSAGHSDVHTKAEMSELQSQNTQLRKRVKILNQQLMEREKAERQQQTETPCGSDVLELQEELSVAQSRLQEQQENLAGLRRALQDTQSRLRDTVANNEALKIDLEATRRQLSDSKREKSDLATLAQQRLEEIEDLTRILQCQKLSGGLPVVGNSPGLLTKQLQQRPDPAEPPLDRIAQYLMSLGNTKPIHVAAGGDKDAPERDKLSSSPQPNVTSQQGHVNLALDQSQRSAEVQLDSRERGLLLDSTLMSQGDRVSLLSGWSAGSESTFNTRDEVAFRDGLAALDASIASLQRTMQLNLRR